jgi:hypothetical protein
MKIYYFLVFVLLNSCATNKMLDKTGVEEISFGHGGGFTGEVKTYKLTPKGKLFEKGTEIKKIDSKTTLKLFKQAKELINIDYNKPGNMYSFLEIKTKDKTNRIVWADASTVVDKRVVELYNELLTNIKQTQNVK